MMIYPLSLVLGTLSLAYLLILTTVVIAGIDTFLGAEIDQLSTRALFSVFPDFEKTANRLMLQQAGACILHALVVCAILIVFGGV
jgi:hypothetical protein